MMSHGSNGTTILITCIAVIAAEVKVLLTRLSTSSAASDPQVLRAEGSRDVL